MHSCDESDDSLRNTSVEVEVNMVVMVWLPSGGLFCGRLAGVMFCAFLGVLEVPVLAGLMLLSQDLLNIRA
jgi:hypothetical protein